MEKTFVQQKTGQSIMRSIWSVAAGFLIIFLLGAIAFTIIALNFPKSYRIPTNQPPPIWITQTYTTIILVATILGGYITASITRQKRIVHVLFLAALWFVFSLATWRVPENPFFFEVVRMAINAGMVVFGGYFSIYKKTASTQ